MNANFKIPSLVLSASLEGIAYFLTGPGKFYALEKLIIVTRRIPFQIVCDVFL